IPNRFHRPRAGWRRPQWGSLRDGLNSRMWPRFNAFMTSIRANIVATLSNKQECLNGGPPFWFFGLFSREPGHIGSGVMQGDEMAATRDRVSDRQRRAAEARTGPHWWTVGGYLSCAIVRFSTATSS